MSSCLLYQSGKCQSLADHSNKYSKQGVVYAQLNKTRHLVSHHIEIITILQIFLIFILQNDYLTFYTSNIWNGRQMNWFKILTFTCAQPNIVTYRAHAQRLWNQIITQDIITNKTSYNLLSKFQVGVGVQTTSCCYTQLHAAHKLRLSGGQTNKIYHYSCIRTKQRSCSMVTRSL